MSPQIAVEHLGKAFGTAHALRDITFEVARGELVVVIGPSGCGKSTLLRCLNGLESFDTGRVRVGDTVLEAGGHGPGDPRLRDLRRKVGMVFQAFNLFPHMTVLENAACPQIVVRRTPRPEAEARARELLAKVGLGDRLEHRPSELSGGQQQRAAIARALAMAPEVMLYDEPTSSLDPGLAADVLRSMRALKDEGMTQVMVTHEMRFAREASDRVLFLHGGSLVESGAPAVLFAAAADARTREFLQGIP